MLNFIGEQTNTPFNPFVLVTFILCILVYLAVFALGYSYYLNAKLKMFSKTKIRWTTYTLLVVVCLLFLAIALSSSIMNWFGDNANYAIPMSWLIFALSLCHLVFSIIVPKLTNKNKVDYTNFMSINFNTFTINEDELVSVENFIKDKQKSYYTLLIQQYEMINLILDKYQPAMFATTIADIVMFNDNFTKRWSTKNNIFIQKKTIELCIKLQQKHKATESFVIPNK